MRIQELNARWRDVDVPLGEVSMGQHQQIYDIGET